MIFFNGLKFSKSLLRIFSPFPFNLVLLGLCDGYPVQRHGALPPDGVHGERGPAPRHRVLDGRQQLQPLKPRVNMSLG